MLASITPLGERGRGKRWGITVTAFVAGSTCGGAALGGGAGALGWLLLAGVPVELRLACVCLALGVGLAADFARAVPGPERQVDEGWLEHYRGWVYGVGFGFQLGLGVVTVVVASAVYVAVAAALVSASPAAGALIGGMGGVLRGLTLAAGARVRTPAQLVRFHVRMRRWEDRAHHAGLVAQAALLAICSGVLLL